jgi:hypothetical protein
MIAENFDYDSALASVYEEVISRDMLDKFTGQAASLVKDTINSGALVEACPGFYRKVDVAGWVEQLRFSFTDESDDLLYKFSLHGKYDYPSLMDKSFIDMMNNEIDTLLYSVPSYIKIGMASTNTGQKRIERLNQLFLIPSIWDLVKNSSTFHDIMHCIYKESYCIYNVRVILKDPYVIPLMPHRDPVWINSNFRKHPIGWVIVNLTDLRYSDGGLRALSGSHRLTGKTLIRNENLSEYLPRSPEIGSIMLLNSGVLHGAYMNTPLETRRSLHVAFVSCEEVFNTANPTINVGRHNIFN